MIMQYSRDIFDVIQSIYKLLFEIHDQPLPFVDKLWAAMNFESLQFTFILPCLVHYLDIIIWPGMRVAKVDHGLLLS